jgi:aspartate carbamoyltransferase catalytic subunit
MYKKLSHHIHTNSILVSENFGFRKETSFESATFKLTDSVLKFLNQKIRDGEIFCDTPKVVESVNH